MSKKEILINLKRFEVNRSLGGVCDNESPAVWLKQAIKEIAEQGLGKHNQFNLTIFVADALLPYAMEQFNELPAELRSNMAIGSQSCHREDVAPEGNFGAFSSLNIASTQAVIGSRASLNGHCEERRELRHVMETYATAIGAELRDEVANAEVSKIVGQKASKAQARDMKIALCIGETAEQQGSGAFEEQKPRIEKVIRTQLENGLSGIKGTVSGDTLTIAYEPVWAIGPGKTPPGSDYVEFIASYIKEVTNELLGFEAKVVYGGGLKRDNAAMLAGIEQLDGGLIALTNFTQPIGFNVDELTRILATYTETLNA
ncbi:MAG: triose-phosphate isomerase [Endozoicomonas sp.]